MTKEEAAIHFSISDSICKQTGITAKWINDGKFAVYGYNHITTSTKDKPSPAAGTGDVLLHHLQTEFIFEHPILRSLLAEASGIFKSVQDAARLPKGREVELLNLSRTYRSTVRACLEQLQDALAIVDHVENDGSNDGNHQAAPSLTSSSVDSVTLQNYVTIFYSVECVWHLCEILLIDPAPANVVVPQLLDWTRFHFPAYERRAAELLFIDRDDMEEEEGGNNAEVLDVCKGLITQGQVDVARTLLRLHTAAETACFQAVDDILRSMPVYSVYGGLSLQKFRTQWQYWVSDTESKLATGCLSAEPDLEMIVQLVSGQQSVWIAHARASSTCWYEFLPGYLFYTEPGCKYFELGTFADAWLRRWSEAKGVSSSALKHLDRVIFKVMENDMHQVVHDCQNMCDNKWFVTHLTDLLYHCGQLQIVGEQQTDVTAALRESLLFDFGTTLMSRPSMWLIGIDYLENSSSEGIGAIELLLPRIPVSNERQAQKIIAVAKAKGFHEVERELCRVQAIRSLNNQRFGNALEWAIRSHDNIFVTAVADRFLDHYAKTGEMMCHDMLANIGAKMFISPRLVFLVKYFDFHEYYKCGEFPQAAELLVNLLDSKITPEYFWPSLLADTIPLLESKEPQFSAKETYIILQHLEHQLIPLIAKKKEALRSGKSQSLDLLNDCRIEHVDDVVRLLRMACARNLSRALIIENTQLP